MTPEQFRPSLWLLSRWFRHISSKCSGKKKLATIRCDLTDSLCIQSIVTYCLFHCISTETAVDYQQSLVRSSRNLFLDRCFHVLSLFTLLLEENSFKIRFSKTQWRTMSCWVSSKLLESLPEVSMITTSKPSSFARWMERDTTGTGSPPRSDSLNHQEKVQTE